MNYYISDLHLFHKNVTRVGKDFDDRPFDNLDEMHALIKEKWNAKVTNGDNVYILGDMAMRGVQEDLIAFVSTLKGHKVMIRGNHDDLRDQRYKQLYDEICDYKEIRDTLKGENVKLVLCHYPILMWKDQHHGSILLYGHVHNSIEECYFRKCLREMNTEDFFDRRAGDKMLRAYNVGCMMPYMDYEPRTLQEIVEGYERVCSKAPNANEPQYGKGPFFLLVTADEWNHDDDRWLGIYVNKKDAREAYDRALEWWDEEQKNERWLSSQRVAMFEYVDFDDRFREVDRKELD